MLGAVPVVRPIHYYGVSSAREVQRHELAGLAEFLYELAAQQRLLGISLFWRRAGTNVGVASDEGLSGNKREPTGFQTGATRIAVVMKVENRFFAAKYINIKNMAEAG